MGSMGFPQWLENPLRTIFNLILGIESITRRLEWLERWSGARALKDAGKSPKGTWSFSRLLPTYHQLSPQHTVLPEVCSTSGASSLLRKCGAGESACFESNFTCTHCMSPRMYGTFLTPGKCITFYVGPMHWDDPWCREFSGNTATIYPINMTSQPQLCLRSQCGYVYVYTCNTCNHLHLYIL